MWKNIKRCFKRKKHIIKKESPVFIQHYKKRFFDAEGPTVFGTSNVLFLTDRCMLIQKGHSKFLIYHGKTINESHTLKNYRIIHDNNSQSIRIQTPVGLVEFDHPQYYLIINGINICRLQDCVKFKSILTELEKYRQKEK